MPKQILLADDSATIARIVQITFANEDAVVTAVRTGDEALSRAKAARPDLVLLDASMPGKSGYDTCAELRAAGLTDVPVLILTGNFGPYDEARGKSAGADGNLVKPFETQALIDRVVQLIAQRGGGARPAAVAPVAPPARVEPHPPTVSAPPVAPPVAPPAPPPRATAMGIPSVVPSGPPGATAMGIPSVTPAAPPAPTAPPRPSVPPTMSAPPRPATPPAPRPAPPPRATLMGIPTVNPANLASLQSSLATPPAPPVKPAPAVQAHHEERTLVEMDAPKIPPPVVAAPPPPVVAAPPPPVVAAPPPPVVVAPPPPVMAAPQPVIAVPTMEMATPARLVALPSNAPQMPRPSLIPNAPMPKARPRNDFDDSFENEQMTRKVDMPIPHQARPEALAPIVRAVTAAVVNDLSPTAPAGGGAALSARGPEYEALTKLSREVIEQIVWEVVPDLAEQIIRGELDRLVKERSRA